MLWLCPTVFAVLECSVPDKPLNGDYSVESFSVGSSVSYRCNGGFFLDGDQERVCQEEGTNNSAAWSGAVPHCLRELTGSVVLSSRFAHSEMYILVVYGQERLAAVDRWLPYTVIMKLYIIVPTH